MPKKEIASSQIRVKPSVRKKLKILASKEGLSMAEYIEVLLTK